MRQLFPKRHIVTAQVQRREVIAFVLVMFGAIWITGEDKVDAWPHIFVVGRPHWLSEAGKYLAYVGFGSYLLCRLFLGRNWQPGAVILADQQLVATGPYRYVRHPIYTSLTVLVIGVGINSPDVVPAAGAMIGMILLASRAASEERLLHQAFGEAYAAYCERTPGKYLPRRPRRVQGPADH